MRARLFFTINMILLDLPITHYASKNVLLVLKTVLTEYISYTRQHGSERSLLWG